MRDIIKIEECLLPLEILEDNDKVMEILEAARTSMGMDISDLDLFNVDRFAKRVNELTAYRQKLHSYVKERMHSCAPSLSALIGEQVTIFMTI